MRTSRNTQEVGNDVGMRPSPPATTAPAPSWAEARTLCAFAGRLSAAHYEVTLGELHARSRGSRRAARARRVAIYLAHVAYGLDLGVVAVNFGRSRRAAAAACRVIEDARDEPAFDAALAGLELSAEVLRNGEKAA
jgi:hypothetical protein